ncbi:glycosyltransferase [Candidatus Dojkabacteria bacterium]|nr:glycosyltransferase [Candidatus Dojkabacteria bacterium]
MEIKKLKVALVHDWLTRMGGAEKCLECFCDIFPEADIYTLIHVKGSVSSKIESHKIFTTFLQKIPFKSKFYRYFFSLAPTAIEQFDFRDYDLVLSGSSCVAKGVIVPHSVLHVSYSYTPMRYAWEMYDEYFGESSTLPLWQRMAIAPQLNYLRMWDVISSNRVDKFIADSKHVADRIEKIYRRDSVVIYPPVDTDFYKLYAQKEDYYLMVTTFEPSKRVDLAISAFNRLGLPLKIVGSYGRYRRLFMRRAKENIEFLGWKSDEELRDLYAKAKALVSPGVEDFGIIPLEAISSGTPVIAYAAGGVLETVIPVNPPVGKKYRSKANGIFFYRHTVHDLVDTIEKFAHVDRTKGWDRTKMRKHAVNFGKKRFITNFRKYLETELAKFDRGRRSAKVIRE